MTNYELWQKLSACALHRARKGNRKFWLFVADIMKKRRGRLSIFDAEKTVKRIPLVARLLFGW